MAIEGDFFNDQSSFMRFSPRSERSHKLLSYLYYSALVCSLFRCTKEWKHAVELADRHGVCVLVASVGMCSRPAPLKRFTYLDFISKDKFKKVWKVLQDMISEFSMVAVVLMKF